MKSVFEQFKAELESIDVNRLAEFAKHKAEVVNQLADLSNRVCDSTELTDEEAYELTKDLFDKLSYFEKPMSFDEIAEQMEREGVL